MRRSWLALAFSAAAVPVAAAEPQDPRADLERLAALLARAVDRVSRPAAFPVLAAGSCRGYRVPGLGAIFVLPPRSLGSGRSLFVLRSDAGTPHPSLGERRPRGRARTSDPHEQQMRMIEAQVQAFQREAERSRLDAEQALAELEQEIRARLAPSRGVVVAALPAPPAPVAPEAPPVPPPPAVASAAPAPWRYWFQAGDEEEVREPAAIVADVRAALTAALEAEGASLASLRPEDLVVTAVDFVAGPSLGPAERPEKTIVLRVRKKDLEERRAGKLGAEELRKRIEYAEY